MRFASTSGCRQPSCSPWDTTAPSPAGGRRPDRWWKHRGGARSLALLRGRGRVLDDAAHRPHLVPARAHPRPPGPHTLSAPLLHRRSGLLPAGRQPRLRLPVSGSSGAADRAARGHPRRVRGDRLLLGKPSTSTSPLFAIPTSDGVVRSPSRTCRSRVLSPANTEHTSSGSRQGVIGHLPGCPYSAHAPASAPSPWARHGYPISRHFHTYLLIRLIMGRSYRLVWRPFGPVLDGRSSPAGPSSVMAAPGNGHHRTGGARP